MQPLFARSDPELNRGTEKQCQVCGKRFSIMVRQHQCKRCLKAVCSDCGSFRREVYSPNFVKGPHRVCKSCKDGSEYICEYIKNNNLKFGEMSAIGERWVKKITKKPVTYGEDTSQHKLLTREVFNQLWNSYSFQLREFVGVLTFQYEQDGVYNMVYNVYTTVISAASGQTLTQVIYLIIFVLCFCSSDKAVLLVLFLLDLKQSQREMRNLAINYLKVMPFNNQLTKIENYVHYRLDRFIDSFLVNCITIEASISLISKTMDRKNLEELLMLFSSHIFTNREMLATKAVENTRMMVDCMMLRNCLLEEINANYKYIKMKNISLLVAESRPTMPINSSPRGNQSLKRMETMGLYSSERQNFKEMSPKGSLEGTQQQSNSQQFRIKPNFIKRAQSENIYMNNDDSFSFVNEGQNKLPFNSSPDKQATDILDSMDESPTNRTSQNEKDSPFRKAMNEEFSTNQLPQLMDLIKPVRKNTEYSETNQRVSITNCEKCQYYIEQSEKSAKLLSDRQTQWLKNQEQYEKFIQEKDRKYEDCRIQKQKLSMVLNDYEKKLTDSQHGFQQLYQKHNYLLKEQNALQEKISFMQRQIIQSRRSRDKLAEQLVVSNNQIKKLNSCLQVEKKQLKEAQLIVISLQKVSEDNSALKEQINRQMSQNNQQKNQLQSKIVSLVKKNEELEMILNQSMSSLSNQSSFYIKKTAQQEITITSLNLALKKAQDEAASLKDKLTQSLKETIRSSETMKSLRTAYQESQRIRQTQSQKIQGKNIQILTLQKQIEQVKTLLSQSELEKNELKTTNDESITQIKIKTKQYTEIQSKLSKQEKTNGELFAKLTQISNLMMQIEQQKMELAEENFSLHEILKKHRIKWE